MSISDWNNLEERLAKQLLEDLSGKLVWYEIPKMIHLYEGPWTPESGLVTPTLKARRKAIMDRFATQIAKKFDQLD